NQRILEISRHLHRGDEDDSDHGISPAVCGIRGEGRHVYKLGALAAVEKYSPANARKLPARSGHRGADFPESARPVSSGKRQVPRPDSEAHVELYRSGEPFAR